MEYNFVNIGFRLLNLKIYVHDAFHWIRQIIISALDFMVALCVNNIKYFIVQLMHTNYKSVDF